jgi:hypothetical protein
MLSLAGKVAVVTGAGSVGPGWGNGKATAVLLARQGAAVFAVDVEPEAVAETRRVIEGEGGTCLPHRCDMLDSEQVEAAMAACRDRFGRLDLLVNNVGGSHPAGRWTCRKRSGTGRSTSTSRPPSSAASTPSRSWSGRNRRRRGQHLLHRRAPHGRGARPLRLQRQQGGHHRLLQIGRHGLRGARHPLQHGGARPDAHAARGAPPRRQLGANDAEALIAKRHASVPMDAWAAAGTWRTPCCSSCPTRRAHHRHGIVVDGGISAAGPV